MEPFSALSVATAVVQFLDFTGKVVSGTYRIYQGNAPRGSESNSDLRSITSGLNALTAHLESSQINIQSGSSPQDANLMVLARNCNAVGRQLLALLTRLQSGSTHSFWPSFRTALRTIWSEADVEKLSRSLDSYRQQISMHILISLRDQAALASQHQSKKLSQTQVTCQEVLDKIVKQGQWQADIIAAIERSHARKSSGTDFIAPPQDMSTKRSSEDLHRAIISTLYFPEVERRYEKISLAHKETFKWVFRSSARSKTWTKLPAWIVDKNAPLYWVTGKAGSGKSTLMRYVVDHEETRNSLQAWAGNQKLITAFFFFWNSGSAMQMSYEGLVRALLYQILEQAPDLVPIALPHKVEAAMLLGEHIYQRIETNVWTSEELLRAFRLIIRKGTAKYRIAFFIDGMDEFQGKPADLVDFVMSLTTSQTKVCAASRPWIVFEDAFGRRPHLRLEDLTHNDINHYVNSKMSASPGFRALHELDSTATREIVDSVCKKSSGVFLWVQLVTQSLLDGLSEGEKLVELQLRLQSLPEDLEDLFKKVLEGLTEKHLARAAQFFQLVRSSDVPLTLLDMSFADEDDPKYGLKARCAVIDPKEANGRAELMRRRLVACCKGLLEAKTIKGGALAHAHVQYLHRTVKDWLEQDSVLVKFQLVSRADFNLNRRLYTVHLMRLKCHSLRDLEDSIIWDPAMAAIGYAGRSDPDTNLLVLLLNEVDKAASYLATTRLSDGSNYLERVSQPWGGNAGHWTWIMIPCRECKSFLGYAVQHGMIDYVRAMLMSMSPSEATLEVPRLIELAKESDSDRALLELLRSHTHQFKIDGRANTPSDRSSLRKKRYCCFCFG
ncbi:hypothetical protein BKA63DRAFT_494933 [Paraphoma chrysanthemicola]|nr:hypothetical protein BKA63DRAFT_494933 [Paraphoma chrysanthemicola]